MDRRTFLQSGAALLLSATGARAADRERGELRAAYGSAGPDDKRPLDGDSVFEIASLTKVLTALVLADMVARWSPASSEPTLQLVSNEASEG
jgi:CubicO group peptidase (beta-lactamase class C family)